MHRYFPCALALTIGLASCATFGGSDQQDWQIYLDGGKAFYAGVVCGKPPLKPEYCTPEARKKAEDAYKLASAAVKAYGEGKTDHDAMLQAVKAAFKLFGDFKG